MTRSTDVLDEPAPTPQPESLPAPSGAPERELEVSRLVTRHGALATLARAADGDVLTVRDAEGRLVVEIYDDPRRVVVSVPDGDLELRADHGRVRIAGARGVDVDTPTFTISAQRVRQVAGVVETHARRILERAKDVYRDVEGLHQLRANDVRTVAKETVRTIASRFRLKAKKDVKIDGDKIHLG